MVKQEIYGFLLAHFVVRESIHQAAVLNLDEDPDKLSFLGAVEVIQEATSPGGSFFPLIAFMPAHYNVSQLGEFPLLGDSQILERSRNGSVDFRLRKGAGGVVAG